MSKTWLSNLGQFIKHSSNNHQKTFIPKASKHNSISHKMNHNAQTGHEYDLGVSSGRKTHPIWRSIWFKKRSKNIPQKLLVFRHHFFSFWDAPGPHFGGVLEVKTGSDEKVKNLWFCMYIQRFGEVGPLKHRHFFSLFQVPRKCWFWDTVFIDFWAKWGTLGTPFFVKKRPKNTPKKRCQKRAFYKPVLAWNGKRAKLMKLSHHLFNTFP